MGATVTGPRAIPGLRRPFLSGWLVTLLAIGLVLPSGSTVLGADPQPTATTSAATAPSPATVPAVSAPPSSREGWEPVAVPTLSPAVELTPSASSEDGIPVDATFTLTSLGDLPVGGLVEGLTVAPTTDLEVLPAAAPDSLVLRPSAALEPGTQYRFELRGADETALGSWVFRTRAPLQVVGTLPRHQATGVPTSTGIEITFDRDGVITPESNFSIRPAVPGHFERRGRVLAFVPDQPLGPNTIYRVTIAPGIRVMGSDALLEDAVRVAFQTRGPRVRDRDWVQFANRVVEVAPGRKPVLEVYVYRHPGDTVPVEIHRYPTLESVTRALRGLRGGPAWAEWQEPVLSTGGLGLVGTFDGSLRRLDPYDQSDRALTLPEPLPAGWYLLSIADDARPTQLILQVTDLAAYAHLTTTDSLVWVNSVGRHAPVPGAEVSVVDGTALGTTDAQGLLVVPTTASLKAAGDAPILLVEQGESAVLIPFSGHTTWWDFGKGRESPTPSFRDRYWTFFYTDRDAYRTTDTINAWGMLRARDDDSVPASVELRLVADDEDYWDDDAGPAVLQATVAPGSSGVYTGSLAYEQLPLGSYVLEAWVDGERADRRWLSLERIVKPAYQLAVSSPRRAYLDGDAIPVSVSATFFDGTQVPAASLTVGSQRAYRAAVTDGLGRANVVVPARNDPDWGQVSLQRIHVRPRQSEEGEITADTQVAVVSSSSYLSADATLMRRVVRVEGAVNAVDLERLDVQVRQVINGRLDPRGRALPGARVSAKVVEVTYPRRQVGTRYDFITKKVEPVYEWRERREPAGTRSLAAGPDGRFSFELPADPGSSYEVELSTTDGAGRTARLQIDARRPYPEDLGARPHLAQAGRKDSDPHGVASVGEQLAVELRLGSQPQPEGGPNRYLFMVQQVGLRRAVVQREPVFPLTFRSADVPMLEIGAVRFTGSTYVAVPDGFSVRLRAQDRRLDIELATDQVRYEPGGRVDLAVRTTDIKGRPSPASVVLRAVDEKLYAMGLAHNASPLGDLYAPVWSGTLRTYASHPLPIGSPRGEGGDAGGGGAPFRGDFRDVLLFQQVETDADGRAQVSFDLSDDLTSWRIAATAVSPDLLAGEATTLAPVGLPFFVELVSAPEYLVGDEVRLRLRAYGPSLERGDAVTFTVSAPGLGMPPTSVPGVAFKVANVALPELVEGRYQVLVEATANVDGKALRDALVRSIGVVPSRLEQTVTAYEPLSAGAAIDGGEGLTRVVVTDAGRGRFYARLVDLATSSGPRADQALAAVQARDLLGRWFDTPDEDLPTVAFDATQFQARDGSISLLPYSSGDGDLSFLVALAAPEAVDQERLADWFDGARWNRRVTRERALQALAARAALGRDVLGELSATGHERDLSTTEQLLLALGLNAAGDTARALAIERELLQEVGQQLGPWVRLWDPAASEVLPALDARERSIVLTALLSILAAELGDEATAIAADAYVQDDPPTATLASLQHLAVVDRLVERSVAAPAVFAWQLDGERQTVELAPGESHHLTLTASQREGLELEPVSGALGIASSWEEPLDPAGARQDESISITRTVVPEGVIRAADTVEVSIEVDLGADAVPGCYLVTDLVPSGLAPIREVAGWPRRRGDAGDVTSPLSIAGQRVTFCAYRDEDKPGVDTGTRHVLRYQARMVTPGSYAWEPTLVQAAEAPGLWRLGEAGRVLLGAGAPGSAVTPEVEGQP